MTNTWTNVEKKLGKYKGKVISPWSKVWVLLKNDFREVLLKSLISSGFKLSDFIDVKKIEKIEKVRWCLYFN